MLYSTNFITIIELMLNRYRVVIVVRDEIIDY